MAAGDSLPSETSGEAFAYFRWVVARAGDGYGVIYPENHGYDPFDTRYERLHHPGICELCSDEWDKLQGYTASICRQHGDTEVTTKVRITNIVDDQAHSNGDVVIHGLAAGRLILAPGETHEEWLKHGDLPEPLVITERWPSQAK